jgi:hypothetical protein
MTTKQLCQQQLAQLSDTLLLLQRRVRQAVAGEISEAVANACAELVTVSLAGPSIPARSAYPSYPTTYARSDWDEVDEREVDTVYTNVPTSEPPSLKSALLLAVAVGSRALLVRQTLTWATLGLGLGTGLAVLYGGPVLRTLFGLWWSVERLRANADVLGDSAKLLERV